MIEQGLTALLAANTTLTGLIGPRLYPVLVPEGSAFPCVSYQDISATSDYTLAGAETQNKRIQFDVWATTYAQCKAVTKALRNALTGYSGTLLDGTRILGVFRVLELDDYEPETRTYRTMNDYRFLYSET
jgi:hypothetical protein